MDSDAPETSKPPPDGSAIYFDGMSSRRRAVTLRFADRLEIIEDERDACGWAYADIRRADSPPGMLRLSCLTAPALARLEIRDTRACAELVSRCAGSMTTRPAAAALPSSSAGRSRPRSRSSPWCCSACRWPPIAWRRWCRTRSSGGSATSPTARSRRVRRQGLRQCRRQKAFVKLVNRDSRVRRPRYLGAVRRAVDADSQCLRAAGRQGLSVRRTAGEGRERRRDRRRAGP